MSIPKFKLSKEFLQKYDGAQPGWKNVIGYITYKRTYARPKADGTTEEYWETLKRVVEGVFTIQQNHCSTNKIPWNAWKAQKSAQKMFTLMWDFKFTPPGRGLWMMGTDYMYKRGGAALNNCAFTSTENINIDFAEPFTFLMDMSMLGVGVGGDTRGAKTVKIQEPVMSDEEHIVDDTREAWVELLRRVLNAYVGNDTMPPSINYSLVRPYGTPIKGFGGTASGPKPLIDLIDDVRTLLDKRINEDIKSTDIVDIFNMVGKCVVSGNVRRSAEIMFGEPDDKEFMELKDPVKNKAALMNHRWASNNSIFAEVGMDYSKVAEKTAMNGEPGYMWLDNAQKYSRMNGVIDNKDRRAKGGNPCLEQTLEPYELCCLVETYPSNHESMEEWYETLKYAYMYAKTITLIPTHNELTNSVMLRNRRIGTSMSGIVQAFEKFGRRNFLKASSIGYDKIQQHDENFSEWFCIPRSKKTTSVKPSGTVSLLAGVTPGIHYPMSEYYIRNIRFQEGTPMLEKLKEANYTIAKDKYSNNTMVVSIPVKENYFKRSVDDVSMWEQLENTAQIQEHWADNQVSVTITFTPEEAKDIGRALELYETRLKGVSFLPKKDHGYEQAPYIPITKMQYKDMKRAIRKIKIFIDEAQHDMTDEFCDGESCQVK